MLKLKTKEDWERYLQEEPELKELAIKAGVENDFERAKELNGCIAVNFGKGVIQSEEERKLAKYMFCYVDADDFRSHLEQRCTMAKAAGIPLSDL